MRGTFLYRSLTVTNGLRDSVKIKAFLHISYFQLFSCCFYPCTPAPKSLQGGSKEALWGSRGAASLAPSLLLMLFPMMTQLFGCQHPPAEPKDTGCWMFICSQVPQKVCLAKLQAMPTALSICRDKKATSRANLYTKQYRRGTVNTSIFTYL